MDLDEACSELDELMWAAENEIRTEAAIEFLHDMTTEASNLLEKLYKRRAAEND